MQKTTTRRPEAEEHIMCIPSRWVSYHHSTRMWPESQPGTFQSPRLIPNADGPLPKARLHRRQKTRKRRICSTLSV